MRITYSTALFYLFSIQLAIAQAVIPEIKTADIPDGKITRLEYYQGTALYGYINGGADLYLEYGFKKALVQEIFWNGYPFRIEIYQMKNEEAAYGIYSISRRNHAAPDSITQFYSHTPHQIKIAHGRLYISIANDGGSSQEQSLAKHMSQIILRKVDAKAFLLPKIFMNEIYLPYITNIKYVRGKLGLQNGFPVWEDLFDGITFSSLYILPISIPKGSITIAQIQFLNEKDKRYFYKKSEIAPIKGEKHSQKVVDGVVKVIKETSPTQIIYVESNIHDEDITPFLKCIETIK
ncbi:MAG: hypothetical protein QME52_09145 [Bacteroidota bacterium]|nr:hypothetical protein [Bacteroidota bacterium]